MTTPNFMVVSWVTHRDIKSYDVIKTNGLWICSLLLDNTNILVRGIFGR